MSANKTTTTTTPATTNLADELLNLRKTSIDDLHKKVDACVADLYGEISEFFRSVASRTAVDTKKIIFTVEFTYDDKVIASDNLFFNKVLEVNNEDVMVKLRDKFLENGFYTKATCSAKAKSAVILVV